MTYHTDGKTKKRLIALLLLISSVISALILVYTSGTEDTKLRSFAQADSLITNTLREFTISRDQYRVTATNVDSVLIRKTYTIQVPPRFSKTLLHSELNRNFHPLSVETPAKVSLPDQRLTIQLVYNGTVFRTLTLQTNNELELNRDIASVLIAIDGSPSSGTVAEVVRFGEPIPIALRVTDATQAQQRLTDFNQQYPHKALWFEPDDGAEDLKSPLPPVSFLDQIPADASVLSFRDLNTLTPGTAGSVTQTASQKNITFIDVSEAMILDSSLGQTLFKQELDKFAERARRQQHPVAIVMADEDALEWLREKLTALKKGGLYLVHPPKITF